MRNKITRYFFNLPNLFFILTLAKPEADQKSDQDRKGKHDKYKPIGQKGIQKKRQFHD